MWRLHLRAEDVGVLESGLRSQVIDEQQKHAVPGRRAAPLWLQGVAGVQPPVQRVLRASSPPADIAARDANVPPEEPPPPPTSPVPPPSPADNRGGDDAARAGGASSTVAVDEFGTRLDELRRQHPAVEVPPEVWTWGLPDLEVFFSSGGTVRPKPPERRTLLKKRTAGEAALEFEVGEALQLQGALLEGLDRKSVV